MTPAAALPRISPGSVPSRGLLVGLGFGLAAALMWAAYLAYARLGVKTGLGPADFIFLRYATAGAIMLPFLLKAGLRDLGGVGWTRGALLALVAGPLFIAAGVGGYVFAPLSHGVVIQPGAITILSLPLAWWALATRPTRPQIAAVVIVAIGLAVIAVSSASGGDAGAWRGDLLFVAAGGLWAIFTVLLRRWSVSALQATAAVAVLSAAVAVPVYLATGGLERLATVPPATLATQVVVQGVFSGVLAVLAYGRAVTLLGPTRAALFTALVPGLALIVGVPVTGEIPTVLQFAGALIVMLGLLAGLNLIKLPNPKGPAS